jgi:hypothetical protein
MYLQCLNVCLHLFCLYSLQQRASKPIQLFTQRKQVRDKQAHYRSKGLSLLKLTVSILNSAKTYWYNLFGQSNFSLTSSERREIMFIYYICDRLCGLVVRVLGYRSGGPGSIPGTTRKKSSGSGMGCTQPRWVQTEKYGRRDPSRWPRSTFYPHKLAITSPTSSGRSVGIVRSRTQTMEF